MLPQLGGVILEILAIQPTLVVSGLQKGVHRVALVVSTEVGDERGSHIHEVGPVFF